MNYQYLHGDKEMVFDQSLGYVTKGRALGREMRKTSNMLALALLGFFVASLLSGVIIGIYAALTGKMNFSHEFAYVFTAFLSTIGLALPFCIYLALKKCPMGQVLPFERVGFAKAALFIVAGLGICLASNFPSMWIASFVEGAGLNPGSQSQLPMDTPIKIILTYITFCLIPAMFEEFVFRGVVLSVLSKYGKGLAVVISSVLFGLLHGNLPSIIFATICGLVMGYVCVKTGNIWLSVVIHFLNNAVAVTQKVIVENNSSDAALIFSSVIFFLPIVLGAVCFVLLSLKGALKLKERAQLVSLGKRAMYILTSPCMIIFLAVSITITIAALVGNPIL